jgi:hypothetical protein
VGGGGGGRGVEVVLAWFCVGLYPPCSASLVYVVELKKVWFLARIQEDESLIPFLVTKRTYVSYVAA